MKQLSLGETNSNEQKNSTATLIEAFFPIYFQIYDYDFELPDTKFTDESNWGITAQLNSRFKTVPSPPPKV